MRSCSQLFLKRIWPRPTRLLWCPRNCQHGLELTSLVPSIKGHQVMMLRIVSLWRLKSRSWLKPISFCSKIEFRCASQSATGSWYLVLRQRGISRNRVVVDVFFRYSICFKWYVCCSLSFKKKNSFCPAQDKSWIYEGLFASCIFHH